MNRFCLNDFHLRALAVLCALMLMLSHSNSPGAQTGEDKSTTVRPTETEKTPATKVAHEELLKHVKALQVRTELIGQTLTTLNGAPIHDRATAIKKNVLTLLFEKDLAGTYPRLEASVENLRWHLHQDKARMKTLANQRTLEVNKTQAEIHKHADDIVALETSLSSVSAEEREELEQQRADRKAELHELLNWRIQQQADANRLAKDAEVYKQELAELGRLQRHLESLNRQARTRIARLVEQVEYQQIMGVSTEIEQARKTIAEVVTLLHSRPSLPVQPNPPALPSSLSIPIVRPALSPPADTDAIRAELQQARERAAKQTPMPLAKP